MIRTWPATVLLLALWSRCAPGSLAYTPPEDSPQAATELKALRRELDDSNYAGAARRLEALLAGRGDQLVNTGDGTLMAINAWPDSLSREQRGELGTEFAKLVSPLARQTLESVRKSPTLRIEELYGVARRFPMTKFAGEALVQAGDLALQGGDFPSAQTLYELALREDVALGQARAARLESLLRINRGEAGGDAVFKPQSGRQAFRGMVPIDAAWFGESRLMGMSKFVPIAFDDQILFATWKSVSLLKESGELVWTAPNPKGPPSWSADRTPYGVRGAYFAPGVLWDAAGRPAVVVVHQPLALSNQLGLRAFSGADGRLLWSTEKTEHRKDISYAGQPMVCGRFVYSVAVTQNNNSSAMLIGSAIDITSGAVVWQTNLGLVTEQGDFARGMRRPFRNEVLNMELFAALSEPAVAGDLVIMTPNCGAILALNRFDGKPRWAHVYRVPEVPDPLRQFRGRNERRWLLEADAQKMLQCRYRSTPVVSGQIVFALPQDVPALFACDLASGKPLWDTDLVEGYAIAGVTADRVIFSGASISAIEPLSGKLKWKYTPPRGTTITGPATVCGQTVIVPVSSGLLQLAAADGKESPVFDVPMMRRLMASDAGRQLMLETGGRTGR